MNRIKQTHPISYNYGRGIRGRYVVHEMTNGKWHWEALGNNGEEDTQNLAIEAARLWITESKIKSQEN